MITSNEHELAALGRKIGAKFLKRKRGPIVLALSGELGSGKTTFVRGLAQGLSIKQHVTSPTFVLAKRYRIPSTNHKLPTTTHRWFWHVDVYRLRNDRDLWGIDFEEMITNPQMFVACKWEDKIKRAVPEGAHWIHFSHLSGNRRKIIFAKE